jgi:uroporphyrinogen decarboxylase
MTPFERLEMTLSGSFADRRFAAPLLSLYGSRLTGVPPERYYRDSALYAAGQRAVAERFSPDALFGPFALALEAAAYGAELVWPDEAPPNVRKPLLRCGAGELPRPKPENDANLAFLVESVQSLAETFRGDRPVAAALTAPTDLPALILGIDAWLELLLFEPEEAEAYLAVAEEHFLSLASALFRAGAAFVLVPIMFANPYVLTEKLIVSSMLPSLRRTFAKLPGPLVFHHGATRIAERVGLFADLPNVAGFALDARDDPAQARAALGPLPLLMSGPYGPNLRRMAPAAVSAAVRRCIDERADDPRFAVITTAADIPRDTPAETVDAFMEAARESGRPHA